MPVSISLSSMPFLSVCVCALLSLCSAQFSASSAVTQTAQTKSWIRESEWNLLLLRLLLFPFCIHWRPEFSAAARWFSPAVSADFVSFPLLFCFRKKKKISSGTCTLFCCTGENSVLCTMNTTSSSEQQQQQQRQSCHKRVNNWAI